MFYLINFINFYKYMLTLNLIPAASFKQAGTGTTKDRKLWKAPKTPVGTFHWYTGSLVTGASIMIGNVGASSKGSVIHKQGWSMSSGTHFKTLVSKHGSFKND